MPPQPRRKTTRRPPEAAHWTNTAGPTTERDVADARVLLGALHGAAADLGSAFRETAPWDYLSPGYDPSRILRILTALQTLIPDQIALWENTLSPSGARAMWMSLLFDDHCRVCELHCHTCHILADALGYERLDGEQIWQRRPENPNADRE